MTTDPTDLNTHNNSPLQSEEGKYERSEISDIGGNWD